MSQIYLTIKKLFVFYILISTICSNKNSNELKMKNNNNISGTIGYQVLKISEPRDTVYTQGLILSNDGKHLYESGGLYFKSSIRKLSYPSLKVESYQKLDDKYFGEGIARCGNVIYQLTWREQDVLKFNAKDLTPLGKIQLDLNMREGWGLTEYSDDILLGTDGSENIYFLDCKENLKMIKRIAVINEGNLLDRINDIVFVNGYIYANRYFDSYVYKINPNSGKVEKKWNMGPLISYELKKGSLSRSGLNNGNVLNGITYDYTRDIFILTGKMWGYLYEIKLED